jgi:exonuclease VII large subunit
MNRALADFSDRRSGARSLFPCLTVILCIVSESAVPHAVQTGVFADWLASQHVGQYVTIEGAVANVHTSRAGNTFLNFGAPYPNQLFSAVVFASSRTRFANLNQWTGRKVRVTGRVQLYQGRPEIILTDSSQLQAAP